jgi:hypothetical protein
MSDNLDRLCDYVLNDYFSDRAGRLLPMLYAVRSRGLADMEADDLFALQMHFAHWMSALAEANKEGKRLVFAARDGGRPPLDVWQQEAHVGANRHLLRMVHSICDGMVWRLLNLDRPFLRLMSEPDRNLGSVDFNTVFPGMKAAAKRLMTQNGSRIIFNDLTNVLRVGDLTELLPDGRVVLHELKGDGTKVKNVYALAAKGAPKVTRQVEHLVKTQAARDFRLIYADDGTIIPIRDVGIEFANDLDALCGTIRRARHLGVSATEVGGYLWVRVTDMVRMRELKFGGTTAGAAIPVPPVPNWGDADHVACLSSVDMCMSDGPNFPRNVTPYAIFPFSHRDCLDLMAGRVIVETELNLSAVARILEGYGWQVTETHEEGLAAMRAILERRAQAGARRMMPSETVPIFRLERGEFNLELPLPQVMRIMTDFIRPSVLAGVAESAYRNATLGLDSVDETYIVGERKVWV